jgi:membrane protein DedA with SNARE-associated domain
MSAGAVDELTGITGFAARGIDAMGEWGVGLFSFAETIVPPIPSEVILPLAGFLTTQGTINLVLVLVTSTLGAYVGALLLYVLGARLGLARAISGLSRLPLVDREDFEKAADWFQRHGRSAVFFGRFFPGVRSLISVPAGAGKMNLATFSIFTIAGSGLWNALLIGLGVLLGAQYHLIDQYSKYLNYAVYAGVAAALAWLLVRAYRRKRERVGQDRR